MFIKFFWNHELTNFINILMLLPTYLLTVNTFFFLLSLSLELVSTKIFCKNTETGEFEERSKSIKDENGKFIRYVKDDNGEWVKYSPENKPQAGI